MKKGNFRKRKFNRKRKNTYKIFFLVIIGMTLGFAAINTTLQLIGTLNISRTTWNIHWENPTKVGGVNATQDVHLKTGDNTTVEYQVNLVNPGDYYEFTVDAKNEGTIDAMVTGFTNKVYENNVEITKPDYLDFIVTYSDDKQIANNHLLASTKSETYKVKVMYKTGLTADQLPTSTSTYKFTFSVTYMQADNNATPVNVDFETSSWSEIIAAYRTNNLTELQQAMNNGTTREVKMDLDNNGIDETYYVRIANLSTPAECSTTGFSQSACGLVIEFSDVIGKHQINPYTNGNTNGDGTKGGWEYSDIRSYVNNDLYNALPSDLKNRIINTTIVTGHGLNDSTNFVTTDKLYLLSTKEVYGKSGTNYVVEYDSAEQETRQLDYYYNKGVTTSNYSGAIKKYNGSNSWWWTRSPFSNSNRNFYGIRSYGYPIEGYSDDPDGFSPAFRIG